MIEAEGMAKLAPDNANAWCLKGNALLELERYEEALQSFDRAINLRPDLSEAWQGKGSSLLRLNRGDEALAALKKAPHTYLACYEKGCALWSLGRHNEAMDALQESIKLNRDDRSIMDQARSLMEKILAHREEQKKGDSDSRPPDADHASPHTYNSPT